MKFDANQIIQWIVMGACLGIGWKLLNFAATFLPTNLPTGG